MRWNAPCAVIAKPIRPHRHQRYLCPAYSFDLNHQVQLFSCLLPDTLSIVSRIGVFYTKDVSSMKRLTATTTLVLTIASLILKTSSIAFLNLIQVLIAIDVKRCKIFRRAHLKWLRLDPLEAKTLKSRSLVLNTLNYTKVPCTKKLFLVADGGSKCLSIVE